MDPTTFCNTVAEILSPRREVVAALRATADVLEAHPLWCPAWKPELRVPDWSRLGYTWSLDTPVKMENARRHLAESARVLGAGQPIGTVRKHADDYTYSVRREVAAGINIEAYAARSLTCEMVDTDEVETYEVAEIPDEIRAQYTVTKTRPVTERVCADLVVPGFGGES